MERQPIRYGYARVSNRDQNLARQLSALRKAGIPDPRIYCDKQSGKDFCRPGYKKLTRKLKKGDELFVKSIDRLGRNYDEILEQWQFLTKVKNVDLVILDFPLLDTRTEKNDLTGKFIADLTLQILCYVAQIERENIRSRQKEGLVEARKRGVQLGRPRMEKPDGFEEIAQQIRDGGLSLREGARQLGICHTTLRNWIVKDV